MSLRRTALLLLVVVSILFYQFSNAAQIPSTLSQAQCILTGTTTDLGSCVLASIPLAVVGLLISFSVGAIAYMAGEVLNYEGLKGWYRAEMWEVFKSVLIVAGVFSILAIVSGLANALTGSPTTAQYAALGCPTTTSTKISTNLVSLYCSDLVNYIIPQMDRVSIAFSAGLGLSFGLSALRSISLSDFFPIPILPPPLPTFASLEFGSDAKLYNSNYLATIGAESNFAFLSNIMTIIIIPVFFIFKIQYDLFSILIPLGFGVLIPMGVILRAIPFLRGIGGTLIAIGIGVTIVYPTLLLVFNLPITNYLAFIIPISQPTVQCPFSGLMCILFIATTIVTGAIAGLPLSFLLSNTNPLVIVQMGTAFLNGLNIGFFGSFDSIFPALNFMVSYTLNIILQFALFAFDLVIGLSVTNEVAKVLGGRIRTQLGSLKLT